MDRVNRHHFCLGGCKTHTRRSYRLIYSSSRLPPLAQPLGVATPDPKLGVGVGAGAGGGAAGASAREGDPIEAAARDFLNMSNTVTGRLTLTPNPNRNPNGNPIPNPNPNPNPYQVTGRRIPFETGSFNI